METKNQTLFFQQVLVFNIFPNVTCQQSELPVWWSRSLSSKIFISTRCTYPALYFSPIFFNFIQYWALHSENTFWVDPIIFSVWKKIKIHVNKTVLTLTIIGVYFHPESLENYMKIFLVDSALQSAWLFQLIIDKYFGASNFKTRGPE